MMTYDTTRAIAAILRSTSEFLDYPLADNRKWIKFYLDDYENRAIAESDKDKYRIEFIVEKSSRLICLLACFLEYPDTNTWTRIGEFLNEYQHLYFLYLSELERERESDEC